MENKDIKIGEAYYTSGKNSSYLFIYNNITNIKASNYADINGSIDICIDTKNNRVYPKYQTLNILSSNTRECTNKEIEYIRFCNNTYDSELSNGVMVRNIISFDEFCELQDKKMNDPDLLDIYKMIDESNKQL
jgi:hypothetical protein